MSDEIPEVLVRGRVPERTAARLSVYGRALGLSREGAVEEAVRDWVLREEARGDYRERLAVESSLRRRQAEKQSRLLR